MTIATVNPATGETLATFEALDNDTIERALARSAEGAAANRRRSFPDRAARMLRIADLLEQRANDYGRLITIEMGKPIKASVAEVRKCALVCRYYAENAERFLADEHIKTDAKDSFVRYLPIGTVLAVMPWNFP